MENQQLNKNGKIKIKAISIIKAATNNQLPSTSKQGNEDENIQTPKKRKLNTSKSSTKPDKPSNDTDTNETCKNTPVSETKAENSKGKNKKSNVESVIPLKKKKPNSTPTEQNKVHLAKETKKKEDKSKNVAQDVQEDPQNKDKEPNLNVDQNENTSTDVSHCTIKLGVEEVKTDRFKLNVPHINLQFHIIDEIALEGLDGITIEALWTRLSIVLKQPLPFPDNIKVFIWNTIKLRTDIEFHKLEKPRQSLVVFDRYERSDPDLGATIEPATAPLDIYPYHPVKSNEILGSSTSFDSRQSITNEIKNLTLDEVELKYGSCLVIVATQKLRLKSLMNCISDPNIEFTVAHYCLLERIGRSRYHGETTQGKVSLQIISKDPKIIFYNRKFLAKNKLISKQPFYMKSVTGNQLSGSLLHLIRFHNEKKTKSQIMTEQIVEILRYKPFYRIEYAEIRKLFSNDRALIKLFKLPEFQKFVKTDVHINYRELYPDASIKEWKLKGNNKEKQIRTVELINPNVNIGGSWNEEEPKEESSDDEDTSEMIYNVPILHQIYEFIKLGGSNGRSIKEILINKGLDFYSTRAAVNQLVNYKLVAGVKIDIGRQRVMKYSCCQLNFDDGNHSLEDNNVVDEVTTLENETTEFLSNLLGIEPKYLTEKTEINNVHETTTVHGNYILIKKIRQEIKSGKLDADKESNQNITTSQKDTNLAILESIFKNQHEYKTEGNKLTHQNQSSEVNTKFKAIFQEICNPLHHTQTDYNKSNKKKLLNKLLLKFKRCDDQSQISFKNISKVCICPLKLSNKSDLNNWRKLCTNILKIVKPVLIHFNYTKVLFPKKLYTCKSYFTKEELQQFSKNHPLLNYEMTFPSTFGLKEGMIDTMEYKRKQEILDSANKRLRLDNSVNLTPLTSCTNIYMGPNPTVGYHSVDEDSIETTILISTRPEEFNEPGSKYIKDNNATLRTLKRARCIMEAVQQEQIITDTRRLHKMIELEDNKDGYNVKVDRKSIDRIYARLVRSGYIKILQIILSSNDVKRSINVVCNPMLDVHHSLVESVIDQLKMKFFISSKRKDSDTPQVNTSDNTFDTSEINLSIGELKLLGNDANNDSYVYNRNIGKEYGFAPKFMRMRILHEFLFHLIYGYPNGEEVEDVEQILNDLNVSLKETVNELPRIYCKEVGWKMFIPPLPHHSGWPQGWALFCDILLRLPLSLFVKLHNVPHVIPELPAYLAHPIKQHYLVRHLPSDICNGILRQRKYIFSIHETLTRLCFIGILQFGPQKLREKDQLFIYLNKNALLLDTTTSRAGYHHTEDKEYKKIKFNFSTFTDVETYWYKMWNICAHSKLGLRHTVTGIYITIERVETKQCLIDSMKPQTQESAFNIDVGYIPGDKRGAAGLDSALWSHIKRNWFWSHTVKTSSESFVDNTKIPHKKRKKKLKKLKTKTQQKTSEKLNKNESEDALNSITESNRRSYTKTVIKSKETNQNGRKKGKSYVRKVLPRVNPIKKKDYDNIDKTLMENLKQSRSEWNDEEDKLLQICKIISTFLCPNYRKKIVPYIIIRDVLHNILSCSKNKTSSACQRRIVVIFGTSDVQEYLQQVIKTLCYVPFVNRYFQNTYDKIKSGAFITESQLYGAFVFLVTYFYEHQTEIQHIFEIIAHKYQFEVKTKKVRAEVEELEKRMAMSLNQNLQETESVQVIAYDCSELTNAKNKTQKLYTQPTMFPKTENDIILDTIKSIIHSTIGNKQDEVTWIYQLFRVYQNYTEEMLKLVLSEIRNSQMVTVKRAISKRNDNLEGLPVTTRFYQFSYNYCFTQITKFPTELFYEAHEVCLGIAKHKEAITNTSNKGLAMECFEQSHAIGLAELAVKIQTHFFLDIPKEVLILNPKITDHTELIRELAVRYKKMLTLLKKGTYFNNDDNDEMTAENLEKEKRYIARTPMTQRFLKSWFLTDDFYEQSDEIEDTSKKVQDHDRHLSSNIQDSILDALTIKNEKRCDNLKKKVEKKKKRTTKMTSEESKKILESLNPQLYVQTRNAEARKRAEDTLPITNNVSSLSFEDYEKKLENLLNSKETGDYNVSFDLTAEDGQKDTETSVDEEESSVVLTDSDSNVLEKYLCSQRHLLKKKSESNVIVNPEPVKSTKAGNMKKDIEISDPPDARIQYLMDDEITTEQIMEEMLKECPSQERKVPKPINLARLLVKGLFPELDEDEERLENLQQHFLIVCPDTNLRLSNFEDDEDYKYIIFEHPLICKQLLRQVQMDIIISETYPTNKEISAKLRNLGSTEVDLIIAEALIEFVLKKRSLGASIQQLKEIFSNLVNLKLSTLLNMLTSMNVLMRTGINYIVYVHHKYRKHWLVESCTLEDQDRVKLKETTNENNEQIDPDVAEFAKSLKSYTEIKLKIMPWARIDGTLNLKVFEKWMGIILGYCLGDSMLPLINLIKTCHFLKPVDIYYLLECLQCLGCIQLVVYKLEKVYLFSSPSSASIYPADITDAFEDTYIETDKMAIVKFGALLNKKQKEFDFPSDDAKKYRTF